MVSQSEYDLISLHLNFFSQLTRDNIRRKAYKRLFVITHLSQI